jgi:hypothetical protein
MSIGSKYLPKFLRIDAFEYERSFMKLTARMQNSFLQVLGVLLLFSPIMHY